MKQISAMKRFVVLCAITLIATVTTLAQAPAAKKPLTFNGKVEAINETAKSLKVNGERVEGWMEAMTMDYKIDDPAMLKKLKAGDQIMATVYEGDMVLHKVMVMPKKDDMKMKK